MELIELREVGTVTIPKAGRRVYFIDTDGTLKELKSDGTKTAVGGSSQQASAQSWLSGIIDFVTAKDATLNKVRWFSSCSSPNDFEPGPVSGTTGSSAIVRAPTGTNLRARLASGTAATSFIQLRNRSLAVPGGASTFDNLISNCRTTPFAMALRCVVNAVNATASMAILNITDEATADSFLGVVGATSQTNFAMKLGAAGAVDTGVAIGTLGTTEHDLIVISDGTNYRAYIDLNTTAVATTLSSNAANAPGHFTSYPNNGATTTNVGHDILYWTLLKA